MKTGLSAAVTFLLTFGAFAQTPERWDIPFDPRDWKLAAEHREGRLSERIYVAPGESEYFWNEKIVVAHQRLAYTPDDYLAGFIAYLDEHCRPYRMQPLQQEHTSVLLQWEGDCRITGHQFEYRRVLVAKDGVHVLAYAAKANRLSEPKREAWLAILRDAKLK
jgi:hypothetical protein